MGRSLCANVESQTLAGLVTRSPPPSLPAPSGGAHTQEAAGCGPALAAAHTSTLLAGQPPSRPLPPSPLSLQPRPHCAARAAQSAARKDTGARGRAPRGRGGPGSRLAPALSSRDPTQPATIPSPAPPRSPPHPPRPAARMRTPEPGTKWTLNFVKT